jgi:hypothetical protein
MRLIALLSWYRENPVWLDDLIGSLVDAGVTHVVAADGPYALYPHTETISTPNEYRALIEACSYYGVSLTLHSPNQAWAGNETQKRTALFKLGHALVSSNDDWFLVIDADELITTTERLEPAVCNWPHDVAVVTHTEHRNGKLVNQHTTRRLFRAQRDGIQVVGAHYRYMAGSTVLSDASRPHTQPQALDLTDTVRITHRPAGRTKQRKADRDAYYEARLQTGIET